MELTKIQAIQILDRATDLNNTGWEYATEDFLDEEKDELPTIMDAFSALGLRKASGFGVLNRYGPKYRCCKTDME